MLMVIPGLWTTTARRRLTELPFFQALRNWRLPSWNQVRTTLVDLVRVAGVEGFARKRVCLDLRDVHEAYPEFGQALLNIWVDNSKADQLVVMNADALTAERVNAAAQACGLADQVTVYQRLEAVLPTPGLGDLREPGRKESPWS